MKRKQRNLSPREQQLISDFIRNICRAKHISEHNEDLYQCAWAAFLSVYRDAPNSFASGCHAWEKAYLTIENALEETRRQNSFWSYRQTSIDQPVSLDIPDSRAQLLRSPHSDFQNSVCFHEYLRHMDTDVRRVAYGLINGNTMGEIQLRYRWDSSYICEVFDSLRTKIQEYIDI